MRKKSLRVVLSQCVEGEPLAVVDGLPGGGAEMRPYELRALAAALQRVASTLERRNHDPCRQVREFQWLLAPDEVAMDRCPVVAARSRSP